MSVGDAWIMSSGVVIPAGGAGAVQIAGAERVAGEHLVVARVGEPAAAESTPGRAARRARSS